uniref:Uncharacterized protein n=1 Tax=Crocodylus porosus TaxID=8502 RepID=A0A7M4ECY2_CROPO
FWRCFGAFCFILATKISHSSSAWQKPGCLVKCGEELNCLRCGSWGGRGEGWFIDLLIILLLLPSACYSIVYPLLP